MKTEKTEGEEVKELPSRKKLHEVIIEQIKSSEIISDEDKKIAIEEIGIIMSDKKYEANNIPANVLASNDINGLFVFYNSPSGDAFWNKIRNSLNKK